MANVNTINNVESLKAFFHSGEILKPLEDGKHTCKVVSFELIEREATEDKPASAWVKLTLKLEDRTVSPLLNEQSLRIILGQMRRQLNIDDNISVPNLMALAMSADSMDVWVSHNVVLNPNTNESRTYTNYAFQEPLNNETKTDIADEDINI